MANVELPWDLIEDILSRVPPQSLVRFRTVSKRWNALLNDNTFVNNHKATFRFILASKSKIYSISVNPKIEVRELTLDITGFKSQKPKRLIDCNGFLLCEMDKGAFVWNPWLGTTRWIEPEVNQPSLQFCGIGYDNDNGYKTLASYQKGELEHTNTSWKLHDCSSDAWNDVNGAMNPGGRTQEKGRILLHTTRGLSLNGTWYRLAFYDNIDKTNYLFFLVNFDFSTETFYYFCDLPCERNRECDALVLRVYREDRFSLLKQSHLTKKIEIWVTKRKIHKSGGEDVEWMNFMEVSIPNIPDLLQKGYHFQPSYFIDNKRLVLCSWDKTGQAWIYVVGEDKLISKTQIDLMVDFWPLHCSFSPSFISVPRLQREEAELQV